MGRSKSLGSGPFASNFSMVFAGVFGGIAAMALVSFACMLLFALGLYLLNHFNKKGTKLFEDLQPMQIVGIVLCILSFLPFMHYFFMGLLFGAGDSLFEGMTQ